MSGYRPRVVFFFRQRAPFIVLQVSRRPLCFRRTLKLYLKEPRARRAFIYVRYLHGRLSGFSSFSEIIVLRYIRASELDMVGGKYFGRRRAKTTMAHERGESGGGKVQGGISSARSHPSRERGEPRAAISTMGKSARTSGPNRDDDRGLRYLE